VVVVVVVAVSPPSMTEVSPVTVKPERTRMMMTVTQLLKRIHA
jgi:hypothetical protein